MNKNWLILIIIFIFLGCKKEDKLEAEIAGITVGVHVERFDRLFSESKPDDLPELKKSYPFMFSKNFTDEDYLARLTDSLQVELHNEVNASFDEFPEEDDIKSLFRHLKYYYKGFQEPRLITVTSDVDYRNKVIVTDTIVLIALDTYLGKDHEYYGNIQNYLKQNFERNMIVSDLAEAYARKNIVKRETRTFLEDMIFYGKILYFKDRMIPFANDEIKMGYSKDQLNWARANESNIWRYFVENEIMFDTDPKLAARFINPAPFSKFNLELDRDSPGRLGQYIGWEIVRAYMINNKVDLHQLLTKDADDIFKNARFKPRK